jgi:glutathione synthase/RimK-type ligase-like ATP-grasp enzyme
MAVERTTIAFVAERRHLRDPALAEARTCLADAGCAVELVIPDDEALYEMPAERPPWDAVVSRGRDLGGLGLLAAAAALGVPAINRPAAVELVRNKIAMQAVLRAHGLPLPHTWFVATASVFRGLPAGAYPLVVKPFDGDGARGIALVTRPADVDLLPELGRQSLYLAQGFLETDGWDLKLYGVGSRVWGVRKPSPVHFDGPGPARIARTDGAQLVELDAQLRDIGLTCGRACGLDLWGVDVAMTPSGPTVIEVNDFPTYSAAPEAGPAIADVVLAAIELDRLASRAGRDHLRTLVRDV